VVLCEQLKSKGRVTVPGILIAVLVEETTRHACEGDDWRLIWEEHARRESGK
jgi:hypothetical protein